MDYEISGETKENSVIGLRVVGDKRQVKPGIACVDIAWVELKYEFLISGTENHVALKGNTSYYDVDGNQGVFMDETCKQIYVTNTGDGTVGKSNVCALHLGWFDTSEYNQPGWDVYQGNYGAVNEETDYTSHAFSEAFEVDESGSMIRIFNFEDYPGNGDGTIYHSGLPVLREGMLTVRKTVVAEDGGVVDEADKAQAFDFTVTLSGSYKNVSGTSVDASTITGTFGQATFTNGVANFKLKSGGSFQITGLPVGISYKVTETECHGYTASVYNVDTGKYDTTNIYTGTVQANVDIKEPPIAEYLNTKKPGDLIIDKTVKVLDEERDGDSFNFTLSSTTLKSTADYEVKSSETVIGTVAFDENGNAVYTATGGTTSDRLPVIAGTPVTICGLPAGAVVTVREVDYDGYAPSWSADGTNYIHRDYADSTTIPMDNEVSVYFLNKTGPALPNTGGIGTNLFTTLGTVMMLGAGVLLLDQRRRKGGPSVT